MQAVLIIDDNEGVRTALQMLFSIHDIRPITCASPDEGLAVIDSHPIDLVIQDMNFSDDTTSGNEGIALFHEIRNRRPDLPVILLTAWTHLETAVELVKAGAADYLSKPWDDEKLLATSRNLLQLSAALREKDAMAASRRQARVELEKNFDLCGTIFESDAMQYVIGTATQIAKSDVSVLITGPNGVGKEQLANIVHANSACAAGPCVKVNVGALPSELIEAELFGAEAGAYTGATTVRKGRFEAADGGTIFLDEIGDLQAAGQTKLLRVLQTGEFERLGSNISRTAQVRVISATNTDLPAAIQQGRFREDLFYRLNGIELSMPSLDDRKEDILPLARHFLDSKFSLSEDANRRLLSYSWPGNVRELQNCIRRAELLAASSEIGVSDLGLELGAASTPNAKGPSEREVRAALDGSNGVVARAARSLGLSRQALYRRMEKYGIK